MKKRDPGQQQFIYKLKYNIWTESSNGSMRKMVYDYGNKDYHNAVSCWAALIIEFPDIPSHIIYTNIYTYISYNLSWTGVSYSH